MYQVAELPKKQATIQEGRPSLVDGRPFPFPGIWKSIDRRYRLPWRLGIVNTLLLELILSEICLDKVTARITDRKTLESISLKICTKEQWSIVGANGSGKSSLGKLLCNALPIISGTLRTAQRAGFVSFEKLNEVLEAERYNDDSDSLGFVSQGTRVDRFILGETAADETKLAGLALQMGFTGILERGIKFLSTGEMRKVLICRALLQEPELLVLDEPFDGLDQQSSAVLRNLISNCVESGIKVVLLLNRFSEIVPETTHIA